MNVLFLKRLHLCKFVNVYVCAQVFYYGKMFVRSCVEYVKKHFAKMGSVGKY